MLRWMPRLFSLLAQTCICIVLIFAPLALGAVEPWAFSLLAVLAWTALAGAVVSVVITRSVRRLWAPMLVPLVLSMVLVGGQYIRWPRALLERASPETVRLYRQAARADPDAALFESRTRLSPSLYRNATRNALVCLSAYVALFLAAVATVRSEKHLSRYAGAAVLGGFLTALLGILQKASGTQEIFWLLNLREGGRFFGPFVSRNQFATYAGVCIFAGLGLILARRSANQSVARQWRDNLRRSVERREQLNLLTGFAVALMAAAVIWSLSRAGTAALVLAAVGVGVAARAVRLLRRPILFGVTALVLVAAVVFYLGADSLVARLEQTREEISTDRLGKLKWTIFRDGLRMGAAHPLLGTGAGTFFSAYPYYRTIRGDTRAYSPENEYIHVFAEMGYPGVVLLGVVLFIAYYEVIRALVVRRNPYALGFLCGGLGVLLMVTLHAVLDFPMRAPALAATVAVLAGALCRASAVGRPCRSGNSDDDPADWGRDIFTGTAFDEEQAAWTRSDVAAAPGFAEIHRAMRSRRLKRRRQRREPLGLGATWATVLVAGFVWLPLCHFLLNPLRGEMTLVHIKKVQGQLGGPARGEAPEGPARPAAVQIDPESVSTFVQDINDFIALRREEILRHSPDDAQLWAALAEFASRAADVFDRQGGNLEVAGIVQRLREEAVALLTEAMRREPLNTDHRFGLVVGYYFLGRPDYAAMEAEEACALQPGDPWIRAFYARQFAELGDLVAAEHFLQEAVRAAERRGTDEADQVIAKAREKIESARRRFPVESGAPPKE